MNSDEDQFIRTISWHRKSFEQPVQIRQLRFNPHIRFL